MTKEPGYVKMISTISKKKKDSSLIIALLKESLGGQTLSDCALSSPIVLGVLPKLVPDFVLLSPRVFIIFPNKGLKLRTSYGPS